MSTGARARPARRAVDSGAQPIRETGFRLSFVEDTARASRTDGDPAIIETQEVIAALYMALLKREAGPEEIEQRVEAQSAGNSLVQMMIDIAESEEAKTVLRHRLNDMFATQDARDQIQACPLTLRAGDVLSTISGEYQASVHRRPSFDEVAEHFSAIVGGARLFDRLHAIASSDEAQTTETKSVKDTRDKFATFITVTYARCLMRPISDGEIDIWYEVYRSGTTYDEILIGIDKCDEARSIQSASQWKEWSDGTFIQLLYQLIVGRGAAPGDIDHYRRNIASGAKKEDILRSFFTQFGREAIEKDVPKPANDPMRAILFGRSKTMSTEDWHRREIELAAAGEVDRRKSFTNFSLNSTRAPLVSVVTSLFEGGRYIEPFLKNITSQSIFEKSCELIIIDANSPEGEFEASRPYLDRFANIHYKKLDSQVGIYEAWNIGIKEARGEYITNANLDDCRRQDSLEIQASALDSLSFVDVVYQDVLYSFIENFDFASIEAYGFATELPIVSRYNLLEFNSPHNGPMWRKSLHTDVGLFDASFRSAGDFDFWMRCVLAGKTFYKTNDAHVAYYVNPNGLSTRADTPGASESNLITKRFNPRLISKYLVMDDGDFQDELLDLTGERITGNDRYTMAQTALRKVSARSRSLQMSAS